MNTDSDGDVTAELVEASYEVKVEKYGSKKPFELTQNNRVLFIEPKKALVAISQNLNRVN